MKPSPLQLERVVFTKVAFEGRPGHDGGAALSPTIEAIITYYEDGEHTAFVKIVQDAKEDLAYSLAAEVFSTFRVDRDNAAAVYKSPSTAPVIVATNVARLLYSAAREMLLTITGRGPHGPAILPSVLIEPGDVKIGSDIAPEEVVRQFFAPEGTPQALLPYPPQSEVTAPAKRTRDRAAQRRGPKQK